MRYYQVILDDSGRKSVLVESNGRFYDLSNGSNSFTNTIDLFKSANDSEKHVDEVSSEIIKNQKPIDGIKIEGLTIKAGARDLTWTKLIFFIWMYFCIFFAKLK